MTGKTTSNINRVLCYDEVGQGEKIVFIHGYISDRRVWSQIRDRWFGTGHLFFPTLGCFGTESQNSNCSDFGFNNHFDDIVNFLETVCITSAHLVGWSYGASLALAVAARRHELVKSVFSYEAGISTFISNKEILQRVQNDRDKMARQAIEMSARGDLKQAVKCIVDCACSQDGLFESLDEELKKIFLDNAETVPLMFTKQSVPNVSSENLKGILCPVTMSFGEYARPAYRLVAEEAVAIIPNSASKMIPDASHVLPITSPEKFQQAVCEHLYRT
jgi:pimeloyl-ACP methyl ester carboxylesterase